MDVWVASHVSSACTRCCPEWHPVAEQCYPDWCASAAVTGAAAVLPDVVGWCLQGPDGSLVPVSVWTSTLQRTIQTAAQLPFAKLRWKALDEIDAGICDGMTYAQIAEKYPGTSLQPARRTSSDTGGH